VLGTMTSVVKPAPEVFSESKEQIEPVIAAGPGESSASEKRMVTVAPEVARGAEPPSRRNLKKKAKAVEINEPGKEGEAARPAGNA